MSKVTTAVMEKSPGSQALTTCPGCGATGGMSPHQKGCYAQGPTYATTANNTSISVRLLHTLCACGMANVGTPHLCLDWHPALMTDAAKADLTAVVRKYVTQPGQPIVSANINEDTLAYITALVRKNADRLVRWNVDADKAILRDNYGNRITLSWGPPDEVGVSELIFTSTEDLEWVRRFVVSHTTERSPSAMATCCSNPDPRIGKSGRAYCNNCRKYLDKMPVPSEPQPAPQPSA